MKSNPFDVGFDTHKLEQSILHGMMNDKETFFNASGLLTDRSFQDRTNARLFEKIRTYERHPIDLGIIHADLSNEDAMAERLMDVVQEGTNQINTWAWMKEKVEKLLMIQTKLDLIAQLTSAQNQIKQGTFSNALEVYATVQGIIEQARGNDSLRNFIASPEMLATELEERGAHAMDSLDSGQEQRLNTGFDLLDECIGGLRPGKLIVIGARPAMGKTALALNMGEHVAFTQKKKVLFVSYEMPRSELVDRIACVHLKKHTRFMTDRSSWDRDTPTEILRIADIIRESCLHIGDMVYTDIDKLIPLIKLHALTEGVDVVIIDYLQLMVSTIYRNKGMKVLEVSDITAKLKRLSIELKIPVIVLSQLNRELEKRQNKRPNTSDLRDSGSIEQDADAILFINRNIAGEIVKREEALGDNEAMIIVAKIRDGQPADIVLGFNSEQTRFLNPKKS